jgi:hypothetical protein
MNPYQSPLKKHSEYKKPDTDWDLALFFFFYFIIYVLLSNMV